MNTAIVWLLIAVSVGGYNHGTVTVVGQFPTENDCEWVRQNIPHSQTEYGDVAARCIRANMVNK